MLFRIGVDDYVNINLISRFKITQDTEVYKLIMFGQDGKVCGTQMFFKNNDVSLKFLNQFIEGVKEITYNPVSGESGSHYITDEDLSLLNQIKNSDIPKSQFLYNGGVVMLCYNGKCYYVKDDKKSEISKEQFNLYHNIYMSSKKESETEDE